MPADKDMTTSPEISMEALWAKKRSSGNVQNGAVRCRDNGWKKKKTVMAMPTGMPERNATTKERRRRRRSC